MTTKIRYNVHTSNKFSIFDSEASEEDTGMKNKVKHNNSRELNRGKSNEEKRGNSNNEINNSNEVKCVQSTPKPMLAKKFLSPLNDRDKHLIPSLNDVVNERAYRTYRENLMNKKNAKNAAVNTNAAASTLTNGVGPNSYYKSSRTYEYKGSMERRPYNHFYRHEKYDYRERAHDYDGTSTRYDRLRRDGYDYRPRGGYYDGGRKSRKPESITIDFDMYRRQQEKKMNLNNRNSDARENKKNEVNTEKNKVINNSNNANSNDNSNNNNNNNNSNSNINDINNNSDTRRKGTNEERKSVQPKKKVLNMYQFLSEERKKHERMPVFYKSYRGYRRGGIGTGVGDKYQNFNNKPKKIIDESILKNRDPPNIFDTRAFPSLTSK